MPQLPKADPAIETLTRTRRIETRLTALMIGLGIDTQAQKPEFVRPDTPDTFTRAVVKLPSPHSSLREILACIPTGWAGEFDVLVGGDHVATLVVSDRT
jgi:hypothetical protein